jgi:hypothetical protein
VGLADAKKPVTHGLERVNFDEVGVIELLGNLKLVLGLSQEFHVGRGRDLYDFQSVRLGVDLTPDMQNRAVSPCSQSPENLKFANGRDTR